jgi:hypothetical protein
MPVDVMRDALCHWFHRRQSLHVHALVQTADYPTTGTLSPDLSAKYIVNADNIQSQYLRLIQFV